MTIKINSYVDVSVVPAWMVNKKCAEQYLLGRTWYECSTNVRLPGPLTEQYLLDNLKWMSEKGLFSGNHDGCVLAHIGFLFGTLSQEQKEHRRYPGREPGYLLKRRWSYDEGYITTRLDFPYRHFE